MMSIIGTWGKRVAAAAASLALCAGMVPAHALAEAEPQVVACQDCPDCQDCQDCRADGCASEHEHEHEHAATCDCDACAQGSEAQLDSMAGHELAVQDIDYHKAPIVKGNPTISKFHLHELLRNKEYAQDGSGDVYQRWSNVEFGSPISRYDPLDCRFWTRYSNGQQHRCVYGMTNGYDYGPTWYDVGDPEYHLIRENCECGGWSLSAASHRDSNYDGLCDGCGGKIVNYCYHEWSDWKTDDTYHWQECGECGAFQWFGKHELYDVGQGVKACKRCTYVTNQYYHIWEQRYDEQEHWEECTLCHETRKHEQHANKWCHDGSNEVDSTKHWQGCDCGWTSNHFNSGAHKWEINYDNDQHWFECSVCHMQGAKQAHSRRCEQRGAGHIWTCELDDCGYESPYGVEEHSYEAKDNGNGTHTKTCAYCDLAAVTEAHTLKKVAQADGSSAYACALCNYRESDASGKLAQAEANTKVKNAEATVTSTSPYNVRIPTLVDVVDAMLGRGGSVSLVFWQGNDAQPSGSEKLSAAMKKSSSGGISTYQSLGRVKWADDRAPIGSGDLYVGVRYDYVEDGQSKSFVTGRTLVGIPRAAADGWEQLPDGRWAYLRQMAPVREEWVQDAGKWYWLDVQGMMATGWKLVDGEWYLFGASGAMKAGWQWSAEYNGWYYLSELHDGLYGHMLRSTTTPDGWQVDATGRWVQ